MTIFYSAKAGGFFDSDVHAAIPDDAKEIARERHAELLAEQSDGRQIVADADGFPVAADRPQPTHAELMAALRRKRDGLLSASDHTQLPDFPAANGERQAWAVYRNALRELPQTFALNPLEVVWPAQPGASGEFA